ncbi:hypothetical protein [Nocardia grenadensis]|uniref:hypothetical protein n=1 Tax=Nocardia grenadensis TaxID=931537 RepID=UPI003D8B06AA
MRWKIMAGAVGAAVASVLLGAGTATAQTAPSVVGMSEQAAVSALTDSGVPYSVISRLGSASRDQCAVTQQRDLGYRTETYQYWNGEKYVTKERQVWKGAGIVLQCQ